MAYIKPPWDDDGLFELALENVEEIVIKNGYTESDISEVVSDFLDLSEYHEDEEWATEVVLFYFDAPLAEDEVAA